jgi:MOSC domain-containing protein YiiM
MRGVLRSLQFGKVRTFEPTIQNGRNWKELSTGFKKVPYGGIVHVNKLGIIGDEVADRANHGGEDKAIFANAMSHYLEWAQALHVKELPYGAMGENFSIDGLDEKSVCIGDIHAFGEVVLQVSQPRKPCYKISRYWCSQGLTHDIYMSGFTGWYYRVLKEGKLQAPCDIQLIQKDPHAITIASANVAFREPSLHPKICEILANHPSLADAWRLDIAKRFSSNNAKNPSYMVQP